MYNINFRFFILTAEYNSWQSSAVWTWFNVYSLPGGVVADRASSTLVRFIFPHAAVAWLRHSG